MEDIYTIIQQFIADEQNESKSAAKIQVTSPSISGSGSGSYLKFNNEPLFYLYFKQNTEAIGTHFT
jgi:hypothetical protein